MFRYLLVLASLIVLFACKSINEKEQMESVYFADPGVKFNTPTFKKDSGFVNYSEMIDFLNLTLKGHDNISSIEYLDASVEGYKIPVVYFSDNMEGDKLKVWFQGGLHGNEPAGTEGLLDLIDKLANDETYQNYLNRLDIAILPMANIDGFNKQQRRNSNNRDLNRDQTKLYEDDSRILKGAFSAFSPDIAFDFHEFNPDKKDFRDLGKEGCSLSYDVLFLATGNLNVPGGLRSLAKDLFIKDAQLVFDDKGISYHEYFSPSKEDGKVYLKQGASNPRSSVSSYSLSNAISVLMEIRGIGIDRTNYNRRVYSYQLVINSFLSTAFDNYFSISATVADAIYQTTEGENAIVLSSKPDVSLRSIRFIDIESNSYVEHQFEVRDLEKQTVLKERERPAGYILMPGSEKLTDRLEILGLELTTLNNNVSLEVEKYIIEESAIAENEFEGVFPNTVVARLEKCTQSFPAGSTIIYLDQKNANLAVSVLEPEMDNGFIFYRVLDAIAGDELPVYRLIKKVK